MGDIELVGEPARSTGGAMPLVRSRFHPPPERFEGCFTTFYHLDLDTGTGGPVEDYLQPEWSNIRFFAGACPEAEIGTSRVEDTRFTATGPSSRPCHFRLGTSRMWGIGFLPVGWARFIEADAESLANVVCDGAAHPAFARFAPLAGVLCDPEATLEEQYDAILEAMDRLMRPNRDEPKIVRVHQALVSGECATVSQLADAGGMSIRTLERVCARYFGFTPKLLMRRQRFMRSLTAFMLREGSRWTEAMDGEYHDQAQFSREFREFMTMNPSEYAALDHPILSAFMEARAKAWGSAAQTLDKPAR
ncbi:AraC family transcriptional regulator [Erythrobacter sp.]|uniref:helix-turn-helix domain-containing protein n=1 Tax=Erythrobacter sp. TaxID=1042 RepID=UPI0025BA2518|nr:helix-turn-helix domain-containing protein [Erythrobacter sp.]